MASSPDVALIMGDLEARLLSCLGNVSETTNVSRSRVLFRRYILKLHLKHYGCTLGPNKYTNKQVTVLFINPYKPASLKQTNKLASQSYSVTCCCSRSLSKLFDRPQQASKQARQDSIQVVYSVCISISITSPVQDAFGDE